MLALAEQNKDAPKAFKFNRVVPADPRHPKHNQPHPFVCLMRVADYWRIGGCDEDFTGHYGCVDSAVWHRARRKVTVETKPDIRLLYYPDGECVMERDNTRNKRLYEQKKKDNSWSTDYVRFPWHEVDLARGEAGPTHFPARRPAAANDGNGRQNPKRKSLLSRWWRRIKRGGGRRHKTAKDVDLTRAVCLQSTTLEDYFWNAAQKGGDDEQWSVNELMPAIAQIVARYQCASAVEFGTAQCRSSCAILMGGAATMVSVDIERDRVVDHFEKLATAAGKTWSQVIGDSAATEIPECDVLFIDSLHNAAHLGKELRQCERVRKIVMLHDTTSYWRRGSGGPGLKAAIEPFLANRPEWKTALRFVHNNGLMVLERR